MICVDDPGGMISSPRDHFAISNSRKRLKSAVRYDIIYNGFKVFSVREGKG